MKLQIKRADYYLVNDDIYDKTAFCGIETLYLTSPDDPFNRPCAGHDEAYERKLYPQDRADELFSERLQVYSWLEDDSWWVKARRGLYNFIVKVAGGFFY